MFYGRLSVPSDWFTATEALVDYLVDILKYLLKVYGENPPEAFLTVLDEV